MAGTKDALRLSPEVAERYAHVPVRVLRGLVVRHDVLHGPIVQRTRREGLILVLDRAGVEPPPGGRAPLVPQAGPGPGLGVGPTPERPRGRPRATPPPAEHLRPAGPPPSAESGGSPLPQFLTPRQVQGLLQISRATLFRKLREGAVPGSVRVFGSWRFDREALLRWLKGGAR